MQISFQTQLTIGVGAVAGAITAYHRPYAYLTGLFVGAVIGYASRNAPLQGIKENPRVFIDLTDFFFVYGVNSIKYIKTFINLFACFFVISKVALPIIFGISLTTLVIGFAGLNTGEYLTGLIQLKQLYNWVFALEGQDLKNDIFTRMTRFLPEESLIFDNHKVVRGVYI